MLATGRSHVDGASRRSTVVHHAGAGPVRCVTVGAGALGDALPVAAVVVAGLAGRFGAGPAVEGAGGAVLAPGVITDPVAAASTAIRFTCAAVLVVGRHALPVAAAGAAVVGTGIAGFVGLLVAGSVAAVALTASSPFDLGHAGYVPQVLAAEGVQIADAGRHVGVVASAGEPDAAAIPAGAAVRFAAVARLALIGLAPAVPAAGTAVRRTGGAILASQGIADRVSARRGGAGAASLGLDQGHADGVPGMLAAEIVHVADAISHLAVHASGGLVGDTAPVAGTAILRTAVAALVVGVAEVVSARGGHRRIGVAGNVRCG